MPDRLHLSLRLAGSVLYRGAVAFPASAHCDASLLGGLMRYQLNKTKYLLDDESAELERVLEKFHVEHFRDTTLIFTLLYTGGRASEVLGIRPSDVSNGTVLVRGLKGSDDREVPVPAWLLDRLMRLKSGSPKLFEISYRRLSQIWNDFRPVEKKLHSLRHTFAIRQLRKHGRLDVVKKLLGHRNISNTMVYADYAYTAEEFKRIVL
jgi:integrase